MLIICDIDCTINDLVEKWLLWINHKYNYYTQYHELKYYSMLKKLSYINRGTNFLNHFPVMIFLIQLNQLRVVGNVYDILTHNTMCILYQPQDRNI